MLVSSLWKPQIIRIEYLMGHFESSSYLLPAFPKIDHKEELEKSKKKKKINPFGVPALEMKTYKYFLVWENRNHWAVRREIPGELIKNAECTEKKKLFYSWILSWLVSGAGVGRSFAGQMVSYGSSGWKLSPWFIDARALHWIYFPFLKLLFENVLEVCETSSIFTASERGFYWRVSWTKSWSFRLSFQILKAINGYCLRWIPWLMFKT